MIFLRPSYKKFKYFCLGFSWLFLVFLFLPQSVFSGNPFFPSAVVYINSSGVKNNGTANSENSKATAISYRSSIIGQSMETDQPGAHQIFAADGSYPAYTMWDTGSSAWTTPQAAGQDMYVIAETYAGLNGWTGTSFVGGSHKLLTASDISDAAATPPDIIMEPIPTPLAAGKSDTALTLQFSALKDRTDIYPAGAWNDAIVGYTIYRSVNNTSTPVKLATVNQPSNGMGNISYTDSTVSQGVNYYYRLAVNYRWTANTPNPWYETKAQGPWSEALFTGSAPDAVKFIAGPISANATIKSGPITLTTYNFTSGDIGNTGTEVVLNLSSNSSGQSKFYVYSGGVCTDTQINSVTIPVGASTASFCYSDTLAGTWTITATPTNSWEAVTQSGENITVGPLDHFSLQLATPQKNGVAFSGTNTVSARDAGNNLITNFSTQDISAVISAPSGAIMNNDSISASDFINGVADLTAKNSTYIGPSGNVVLTVTSQNGKIGTTTLAITPGVLNKIILRDTVKGGGSPISSLTMTVDNTLSIFAAGYDISDNFINDIAGTWSVTGSLNNLGTSSTASIIFAPSIAPTSGTITYTDGAGHNAATGNISVNHGALASFSVPQNISNQVAGTAFTLGQISALDAKGNVVTSYDATVILSDSSGSLTPTVSGVFKNGILTGQNVNITKAQSGIKINVTDGAKTASSNEFQVLPAALDHFAWAVTSPQTNTKKWTGANTIAAQDKWNNYITNYNASGSTVTITTEASSTLNNNVINASDFVNGLADVSAKNFSYTGLKGTINFRATADSGQFGTTTVAIVPGDINSVIIRNAPNNGGSEQGKYDMEVGQNLVLYAAAYDISGNYIADTPGIWTRTGTLDSPVAGSSAYINYQPMSAYTNGNIRFDDGAGHNDETGLIYVNRGPLDHFELNLQSPQTNGVAFSGVNTISAKDIGNNTITDYNLNGTTVTITTNSAGAVLKNNVFAKSDFASGVADLSSAGFSYVGSAGTSTLIATATSGKSGSASLTIAVGSLHHFDFSLSPAQLINVPFTGVNTLSAKDVGNNTITNFNSLVDNVTLTFSPSSDGVNKPTGLGGPEGNVLLAASDFVGGVANLTGRLTFPGAGGGYTFSALSASGKTGTSNGVDIDVGPLHHFGFETISEQRAGTSFDVIIKAYAQDPQGHNHVKVSYSGSVNINDDSGTIIPASVGPFVNGQAIAHVTITKAMKGNVIHVADSVDSKISGSSNAFDLNSGPLHHFSFVGTINNQVAGQNFDLGRVEARDQWDNIVNDFSGQPTIKDLTGTLQSTSTKPFVAGILADEQAVITKIKTGNSLTLDYLGKIGTSNAFNIMVGPITNIVISEQAGGNGLALGDRTMSADDSLTIYAVGYDAYGNYNSEVPGSWTASGNLDSPTSGAHSSIVYAPNIASTTGSIIFTDGAGHKAQTGVINVKPGALVGFTFELSSTQQVGVVFSSSSRLIAKDAKGNTITNFNASVDNVALTASTGGQILGLGSDNNNVINTALSFVNGSASLSDLGVIYAGVTGKVSLSAISSSGKSGISEPVNFLVGPLDHFQVVLGSVQKNASPVTAPASITAVDRGGNAITDFNAAIDPISVSVTPNDGVISGLSGGMALNSADDFISGVSNLSNKFMFTGKKGQHTFSFSSASSKYGSTTVEILPGILSYIQIRNAAGGNGGIIGDQTLVAGDALQLFAAAYDASDNFIQDQTVSWIGTGVSAGLLQPINSVSTSFSALIPGEGIIHASIGSVQAQTGTLKVKTGAAAKIVLLNDPYDGQYHKTPLPPRSNNAPLIAGQISKALTLQVQDIVGNVVVVTSDLNVQAAATGASAGLNGEFSDKDVAPWLTYSNFTIKAGESRADIYYKNENAGTYNLEFTPENTSISKATQPLIVVPTYNNSLVFITAPQNLKAGQMSAQLTLELRAADGSVATSSEPITISLISNSPGTKKFYFDADGSAEVDSLTLPAGKSQISFYYKDTAVTRSLITAKASGLTDAYQLIDISAGDPKRLFITPGSSASDGQNIVQGYSSAKITVQVLDEFNNIVTLDSATSLHLSAADALGEFAGEGTGGIWKSASTSPTIMIPAGAGQTTFYYRSGTLGQAMITASAHPEHDWSDATQVETIYAPVITKLAFITPEYRLDTNMISPIMTIQTQDLMGNAVVVDADTNVSLITSDNAGGRFALKSDGPWGVDSVTIPSGQSSANFYYQDKTPGSKTLGISETPSKDWSDAIQKITINAGAVSKLSFVSNGQTIAKNTPSGAITLQLQDAKGYPTVSDKDTTVLISTNSATGAFSTDYVNGPWNTNQLVIPAGESNVVFYYRDQNPGTYILNADVTGALTLTTNQTVSVTQGVISQIAYISEPQSIAVDAASNLITIQTQNANGDPVEVLADTTINLSVDSSTGKFSLATSTGWGLTSVVIPAGQNKTSFYYHDTAAGTFLLKATETPTKNWNAGGQQIVIGSIENTIAKLKFTSPTQTGSKAISSGEISSRISIQTQSILNNPVAVTQTTYLVLNSSNQSGRFSLTAEGPFSNSLVLTLKPGQSGSNFYYTDTIQGTAVLSVSEFPSIGWQDDNQPLEIKAGNISQLNFTTGVQSILTGQMSKIITIQTREVYGNTKSVDEDTEIALSSTSGTGHFYASPESTTPLASVTIPANSNSVSAYYKDNSSGSYTLTASAPGKNWSAASQSLTVTEATPAKIVIKPDYALLPTDTNVQLTAVAYNSAGNPLPNMPISWSVSSPGAGQISNEGVLSTKGNLGVYNNVVQASAGGLKAYATVEVYEKMKELATTSSTITLPAATTSGGGSGVVYVNTPTISGPVSTNNSTPMSAAAPTNVLAYINDDAIETTDSTVNLNLYATGASYVKVSENPDFNGAKWQDYRPDLKLPLSSGYGLKKIYVKYKSASGLESAATEVTINYVKKLSAQSIASTVSGTNRIEQIIKKYNYIILHEQQAGQAPTLPQVLSPTPNSFVLDNSLTITGTALPNTIVTLHIHSPREIVVKVVTDENGQFVYNLDETTLEKGEHKIYASLESQGGNLIGPAISFGVIKSAAAAATITAVKTVNQAADFSIYSFRFWFWIILWLLTIAFLLWSVYEFASGRGWPFRRIGNFLRHLPEHARKIPESLTLSKLKNLLNSLRKHQ